MTREDLVKYWTESSDKDFDSMNRMFDSGDYHWSLYVGHLVIEKLLKAYYVQKNLL
jgi:HEPN domain-containing protein